ncbi:hypothetical protein GCM10009827_073780 [Dactylosporangium maewongense]|uniref:Uncharacterized protein n=1 Tax=Dactylosporangium maewongense TaxID=634393 RepID=A0ABP4MFI4_9ACTN
MYLLCSLTWNDLLPELTGTDPRRRREAAWHLVRGAGPENVIDEVVRGLLADADPVLRRTGIAVVDRLGLTHLHPDVRWRMTATVGSATTPEHASMRSSVLLGRTWTPRWRRGASNGSQKQLQFPARTTDAAHVTALQHQPLTTEAAPLAQCPPGNLLTVGGQVSLRHIRPRVSAASSTHHRCPG